MRKSGSLGLNLPELTDKISLEPINENTERLEQEIISLCHPNLLDNWYFADPINQRGQTEYTLTANYQYTIDRWWGYRIGGVIRLSENGVTIILSENGYTSLAQQLNVTLAALAGKQVTISAIINGKLESVTADIPQSGGEDTVFATRNTGEYAIKIRHTSIRGMFCEIVVPVTATEAVTVFAVKAELGSVQTLAQQDADGNWILNDLPPDKDMELLKCCMSTADANDTYANNRKTYAALNCAKIATGAYTGTGTYEEDSPCTLTFDFKPRTLLLTRTADMLMPDGYYFTDGISATSLRGMAMFTSDETKWYGGAYTYTTEIGGYSYGADLLLNFEWGDNSVSWYGSIGSGNTSDNAAKAQFNGSGTKYYYVAIG